MPRYVAQFCSVCFLIVCVLMIPSCEEDVDILVTSVDPDTGYTGNLVTINGSGFDPAGTSVVFHNSVAPIISVTENQIKVKAPHGTGAVTISILAFGKIIAGPTFTFKIAPHADIFAPTAVMVTEATLQGGLTFEGTETINAWGFQYSVDESMANFATVSLGPTNKQANFSARVTSLTKNTVYFVRSFVQNGDTTVFSEPIPFITADTNQWVKSSNAVTGMSDQLFSPQFPRENNYPVINGNIYLIPAAASTGGASVAALYALDPQASRAERMFDVPGVLRNHLARFAIGNKFYAGMGQVPTGNLDIPADFWSFSIDTKFWTRVKDFGGTPMASGVSIVLDGRAYVGFGTGHVGFEETFWQYDPATDSWLQRSASPFDTGFGLERVVMAVALNGMGYFAFHRANGTEVWEYSPATDSWLRKADFAGTLEGVNSGSVHPFLSFASATRGYFSDQAGNVWEYNPGADTWKKLKASPNKGTFGFGYAIENRIYLGDQAQTYMLVPE